MNALELLLEHRRGTRLEHSSVTKSLARLNKILRQLDESIYRVCVHDWGPTECRICGSTRIQTEQEQAEQEQAEQEQPSIN